MRCRAVAALLLVAPLLGGARLSDDVDLDAIFALEYGLGTRGPESQMLQLIADPELAVRLPANLEMTAIGRLRVDAFDRMMVGSQEPLTLAPSTRPYLAGDRVELELRELWLEGEVRKTWFRIGKQQIVWGQADGLKVLDIVNPQSFREFILTDFDRSRIPLWALNVEVPVFAEAALQLVWLPDPSYHRFPTEGSVFEFTSPRVVGPPPPPGIAVDVRDPARPSNRFLDSDAGLKLSGRLGNWDVTANYLYHYWDTPTPNRVLSGAVSGSPPKATVTPTFHRTHTAGATASNTFGNLAVRGELAWHSDRWFPTTALAGEGVAHSGELGWVLGLDWYGFDETLLSAQLFQSWVLEPAPGLIRDGFESLVTVLARRTFRNERLTAQAMWIHNINDGDGVLRPRLGYLLRENLEVWTGLDWFYGKASGLFGEFDSSDRVVVGVRFGL